MDILEAKTPYLRRFYGSSRIFADEAGRMFGGDGGITTNYTKSLILNIILLLLFVIKT